jgi:hypothetical protein
MTHDGRCVYNKVLKMEKWHRIYKYREQVIISHHWKIIILILLKSKYIKRLILECRNSWAQIKAEHFCKEKVCLMVFNATFNNISAISWQSVLLLEETEGPRENHRAFICAQEFLHSNISLLIYCKYLS